MHQDLILWLALGLVVVVFVVVALSRRMLEKKLGFKPCAICAAVSLTWVALLGLKFAGIEINSLLIGILMGESVVGIMYLFERKAQENGKGHLLWMKAVIIVLGTLLVYLLLTYGFNMALAVVAIISLVLGMALYTLVQEKDEKNIAGDPIKHTADSALRKLGEKLKHCCD